MYRVLIVDDEPIIRNGIKAFIQWEKEGLIAEADSANGMEALAAMENRPADILITDIKMPLMNGIQLMQKALQLYPRLKVIMISSYSDFEYAREGLKLGAVDYLLKPTLEPEDLLAVLKRCMEMLEDEKRTELERARYYQDSVYWERKKLEQEMKKSMLMSGKETPIDPDAVPDWLEEPIHCVYLTLDHAEELKETYGNMHTQLLLEELQKLFYGRFQTGIALLVSDPALLLLLPDQAGAAEQIREWKRELEGTQGVSISLGMSSVNGLSEIRKGSELCKLACQRRFFEGLGGIYSAKSQITDQASNGNPVIEESLDWTGLSERIRGSSSTAEVMEMLHERWIEGYAPDQIRQEACRLLTEVYPIQAEAVTLLPESLHLLQQAETLELVVANLSRQLQEIGKVPAAKLADKGYGGQLIAKALEYMAAHFKEELTLQSTADAVHISKSYFSLLFKKLIGQNFIDYLIDLRISEAKRLLATKDYKIYEVAEASGFHDVKYFSKLFKKITGLTPVEYRDKNQTQG